ncbi:MAG: butyrate kinase [Candidatus Kapaibacterium sp.]
MKVLSINPGSTSTKIAYWNDLELLFVKILRHKADVLAEYRNITDQYDFRKRIILDALKEENVEISDIEAVVGRGGMLKPIPGGIYKVNNALVEDLRKGIMGEHASNLGGILAREIARETGKDVNAYIVDPVVVDEMDEIARYSGRPEMPRVSIFHALNQKAVSRRYARENKKSYDELNLIVAHMGGGITVGAHKNGRVIDVNNGLDGEGPFSPERTGQLPVGALTRLCFSGKYQLHEVKKMITGKGGMVAYLGTNDAYEVEQNMGKGDQKAKMVYLAMAYQIAKEIGACATVLEGNVDAILLTGGLAKSEPLIKWISKRTSFIAPISVYPGEDEMQAMAEAVHYAHKGELQIREYV